MIYIPKDILFRNYSGRYQFLSEEDFEQLYSSKRSFKLLLGTYL